MRWIGIALALTVALSAAGQDVHLQRIIDDVYGQLAEVGEVDYEEVQEDLLDLAAHPIDLNHTTADELLRLRFLSEQQIDAILLYVYQHPMQQLTELQMIPSLADYDIRNLRAFVTLHPADGQDGQDSLQIKDLFRYAKHEALLRVDARNIETNTAQNGTDPVFVQARYKFNAANRVQFGLNVRRPVGAKAEDMEYGAYLQLNDIGAMRTLVAGNFQASFGQGLVFASPFYGGRSGYVMTVGNAPNGLRKYSSTDGTGLHGVGTTFVVRRGKTRLDMTALYSMQAANDSVWRHVLGANFTLRHKRLQVGVTMAENLYSDTLRLYRNMAYNAHYFRGLRQAVIGINARYNYGRFDLFGEVAAAQNSTWGVAAQVGCRMTPAEGLGMILLYRYYSPWFDNTLGYGFSETSRINDENGLYVGMDISRLRNWRFALYGDLFRFEGIKYGIPYAPSMGYDAMGEATYAPKGSDWQMAFRLRAREKGRKGTYSARCRCEWHRGQWYLRTQAEANIAADSTGYTGWGASILQDVEYTCRRIPMTVLGRLQGFDARAYANRIYTTEHDVLYGYSVPFVYGQGVRMYLNLRWRIIAPLSLYLRLSETLYAHTTVAQRAVPATRTDVHLLLRLTLG